MNLNSIKLVLMSAILALASLPLLSPAAQAVETMVGQAAIGAITDTATGHIYRSRPFTIEVIKQHNGNIHVIVHNNGAKAAHVSLHNNASGRTHADVHANGSGLTHVEAHDNSNGKLRVTVTKQ